MDHERGQSTQRLLLGTHTSGDDPNCLIVAQTNLPLPRHESSQDTNTDPSGFSANGARIDADQRIIHEGEVFTWALTYNAVTLCPAYYHFVIA